MVLLDIKEGTQMFATDLRSQKDLPLGDVMKIEEISAIKGSLSTRHVAVTNMGYRISIRCTRDEEEVSE